MVQRKKYFRARPSIPSSRRLNEPVTRREAQDSDQILLESSSEALQRTGTADEDPVRLLRALAG